MEGDLKLKSDQTRTEPSRLTDIVAVGEVRRIVAVEEVRRVPDRDTAVPDSMTWRSAYALFQDNIVNKLGYCSALRYNEQSCSDIVSG